MTTRRQYATILLVLGLCLVAGCGPAVKEAPLVRARGVVTFNGAPLENAVVVFEGDDGSYSYSATDSRGRYRLRFDSQTLGVAPGKKIVRISMNRRIHGLNSNDEGGPDDRAGGAFPEQPSEIIPERYNVSSTLSVVVTPEDKTFDFDLRE
jgi:hypothetical protein